MEAPSLVNLADRPKVNRKRDKDESLKRQTEWVAPRRGRVMTCSTCRVIGHNSRGCQKFDRTSGEGTKTGQLKNKNQKLIGQVSGEGASKTRPLKSKKQMKDKQLMKRHRTLIDEEDEDPSPPSYRTVETAEDLPLTAPQPSQDSASSQSLFDPSPTDLDFEEDIPWRPRGVSEF